MPRTSDSTTEMAEAPVEETQPMQSSPRTSQRSKGTHNVRLGSEEYGEILSAIKSRVGVNTDEDAVKALLDFYAKILANWQADGQLVLKDRSGQCVIVENITDVDDF